MIKTVPTFLQPLIYISFAELLMRYTVTYANTRDMRPYSQCLSNFMVLVKVGNLFLESVI